MALTKGFTKDPQAVLDYVWDWSAWLGSDVITDHTVTAPEGITVDSSSHTDTAVTAWISGGSHRRSYVVTCHITTLGGRADDRSVVFQVQSR